MDKEKLAQRLMAVFLAELDEHVAALDRDVLALEKDPGPGRAELVHTLFRTAHSLKGAARSVNLDVIAAACHRLEEMLAAAREGASALPPAQFQVLFAAADALRDAARRLRASEGLAGSPIAALAARLDAGRPSPSVRPPEPAPRVAPPAEPPARDEPLRRTTPSRATPFPGESTLRVASERLDRIVSQSGELLVARRRVAARAADAQDLSDLVTRMRRDFRAVESALRASRGSASPSAGGAGPASALPRRAARALERVSEGLRQLERGAERFSGSLKTDLHLLEQTAGPLDDEIRRVRLLPFGQGCEGLERAVRDLARNTGKDVELSIAGAGVEMDRSILENLRGPLLHLVRNAVDHGVEPPHLRAAAGKPRTARIVVAAEQKGGGIEVSVADDGRGIDLPAVREQAARRGVSVPADETALTRLILQAGFSTADSVTELSGRGVGLDVVRHAVEAMRGSVEIRSEPGRGARFVLSLPLTLSTLRALLVRAGGQTYAFPSASVVRLQRVATENLVSVEGRDALRSDGAPVPLLRLAAVLGASPGEGPARATLPVVLLASGGRNLALVVDEFVSEQEIIVKGLGARIRRVRHVAGATLLATGQVALILSPAEVVETGLGMRSAPKIARAPDAAAGTPKRLLVVDDSVTTRTLEKTVLEAAGFEVVTAADGAEAWHLLHERAPDLVVTDVEMPRMDGLALTRQIRASARFRELPVVLVTALESDADRARGLEAGADAYLRKSAFDQGRLLEVIGQLL